jgi:ribosomal protein S12 methylthiotransferase accessory factor
MIVFSEDVSQPKSFFQGTHRACDPVVTWKWLLPKARAVGVTRVANVTGLDAIDLPVWVAVRPNARGLSTSQGKGLSNDAARVSAAMESVENWHGETIDRPVRIGDWESMKRHAPAVDPESLNYYHDSPPRPDLAMPWMEAFDLISGSPRWVPYESVSTDYVVKSDGSFRSTFVQSSNGLAGGNHILEAIEHALSELIERHAISRDIARIRAFDPAIRIDAGSIQDPACRDVLRRIEAAGVRTAIFSLPSGFGVPVFACSIMQVDESVRWRSLPPFNGYGCHLEPSVALLRALTEAVQSRVTYIAGSRDDISLAEYGRSGNPDDLKVYRSLFEREASGLFPKSSSSAYFSFEEDVQHLVRVLVANGYDQVLVTDLRKPGVAVPVVKVVVPGLGTPEALIRGRSVHTPPLREVETAV